MKKKKNIIFLRISVITVILLHLLFYIYTKNYLISSGVCLYIILFTLIYWIVLGINKLFKVKFQKDKLKLSIYTTLAVFSLIELIFIFTGYLNTYLENRHKYYFESPYSKWQDSWFRVWGENHYLKTPEYSFYREINSLGFSDIEPKIEKDTNEFRILALGDSFTEGDGSHADSTWMKFLERKIAKEDFGKSFNFINAGICGSDPFYEYVLLKEKLLKYKPNLIIVMINESDVYDVIFRGGMERFAPDYKLNLPKAPWFEPIFAMSHLSRLIFQYLGYNEYMIQTSTQTKKFELSEKQIYDVIIEFQKLADENEIKFIIAMNPIKHELIKKKYTMQNLSDKLEADSSLIYLNLLNYFLYEEKITNFDNLFWVHDGHNNAKGYEVLARGLLHRIRNGILDNYNE